MRDMGRGQGRSGVRRTLSYERWEDAPSEARAAMEESWREPLRARRQPSPQRRRAVGDPGTDPWEPFVNVSFDEGALWVTPRGRASVRSTRSTRSSGWTVLSVACVLLLIVMAYAVISFREPYTRYKDKVARMNREAFLDGIFVDGLSIGGMSVKQAEAALETGWAAGKEALTLSITVDGTTWVITDRHIPFTRNLRPVLEEAYAMGRQGFRWMIGSDKTPFETRYLQSQQILATNAFFTTEVSYQKSSVRALVQNIVSSVNRNPINAVVASFDFNTRAFSVTQDVAGAWLDGEDLYERITEALDRGDFSAAISVISTPLLPTVTTVELKNSFAVLSSFWTETTSDEKRNTNVRLATEAINGTTVMPGETLSFNKRVGERTAQKGYQMAPAIAGGIMSDEIGGGVCQVSSTLFNAAAMAGMTIVSRAPHAWPSTYVDMGRDATVNWPNLDFSFRNDRNTPVFLLASYSKRRIGVEIYGMITGPGESIELEPVLLSANDPPGEPIFQQNPLLPAGVQQELKKARTGYVVDTYRVFYRDGKEYRREKLFTSNYPPIQQVIEYN